MAARDILERTRLICLALPETTAHTDVQTVFKVRDKTFVWFMNDHHGDGRLALWLKAAPGVQGVLVGQDPKRFFVPPYVGHSGWVGLRLDSGPIDWEETEELIEESYRMMAPKRLVALLDQGETRIG